MKYFSRIIHLFGTVLVGTVSLLDGKIAEGIINYQNRVGELEEVEIHFFESGVKE